MQHHERRTFRQIHNSLILWVIFYGCRESLLTFWYVNVPLTQRRTASKPKAASEQPSISTLASFGIKVRDFAYESKLSPIKTVYCHPRQIQPALVRTTLSMKRQWTESGEDDHFSRSSSQPGTCQKTLKRTSTERLILSTPDSTDIDQTTTFLSRISIHNQIIQTEEKLERTSTDSTIIPSSPYSTDVDSDNDSDTDSHWQFKDY